MRDLFPSHYPPTPEDIERIWSKGLFVFDTNVLLDIFRYSEETAEQLLATLEKLKDRVWLPYQAAMEYHRHLEDIIIEQKKTYDDAIKQIDTLQGSFQAPREHPFLPAGLADEAGELFERLRVSLRASENRMAKLLNKNPSKERLAAIFGAERSGLHGREAREQAVSGKVDAMARPLIDDELWALVEPLLPPPKPRRFRYPGRRPADDRAALAGIVFVLKTGIQWQDLLAEMGACAA